ncbi:MAG: hypothetical protein ACQEXJ_00035 [Myxococcota bacterium]
MSGRRSGGEWGWLVALAAVALVGAAACDAGGDGAETSADTADAADTALSEGEVAAEDVVAEEDAGPDGAGEDTGGSETACLEVGPLVMNFGWTPVGHTKDLQVMVTACGEGSATVEDVALAAGADPGFSVVAEDLPGLPVVLGPGEAVWFDVAYAPESTSPADDPDEAVLVVTSDAPDSPHEVTLQGRGVDDNSPGLFIALDEAWTVLPQTVLHLSAAGTLVEEEGHSLQWSVVQPEGSASVFQPAATVAQPAFEANVAGTYVFTVDALDPDGEVAGSHETMVQAVPGQPVHVELLWETPGDPDPTDTGPGAGADMDLHFAHPDAASADVDEDGQPDPWFDQERDVFWFNPAPDWGSLDATTEDDPSLDRDDTDGAGPENLNFTPAEGGTYRMAVHYWDAHDFGPSTPTVRVYLDAALVYEVEGPPMDEHDLWEVGTLDWPTGDVTPAEAPGGGPVVVPDYVNPFFVP